MKFIGGCPADVPGGCWLLLTTILLWKRSVKCLQVLSTCLLT